MSHQNSLSKLFLGEHLDIRLAKIGLVLSLLLLSLRLLAEQILLVVIPLAGASACGLYLITRNQEATGFEHRAYRTEIAGYLPSFVFLGLASLILLIRFTGGRSLGSHLLTGVIGAFLLLQILLLEHERLSPVFVLGQILIAALVIRLSAVFGNPGYIGVDIWTHLPVFAAGIADAGSLAPIAEYKYVMAPIYHLNAAVGALLFGDVRIGAFLTLGVVLSLTAVMIYTTTRLLVPARWALLATALFAFSDQAIRWSLHIIPTSLGLVFFLGALYSLTKLYFRMDVRYVGLLLVFSLAVVFTHQVSTAVILLLLGVAAGVSVWTTIASGVAGGLANNLRTASLFGVFGTTLGVTLLSWANTPFSGDFIFLWRMLDVLEATILGEAGFLNLASGGEGGGGAGGATAERTGLMADLLPAIEWFGFGILLAATVLGAIMLIRRSDSRELTMTYLLVFGGMFFVVYGLSLFGIRTFMPGRWLAFLYAPMAIISAVGLYYVFEHASMRVLFVVILLVAVGYPTTMVVAEKATLDSPAIDSEYPRFAYTSAEIGAVDTVSEIRGPVIEEEIATDHPYRSLYDRVGDYETPDLRVDEQGETTAGTVVHREYQLDGPATVFDTGDPPLPHQSNTYLSESICTPTRNHLYTNDAVTLCTVGGAES